MEGSAMPPPGGNAAEPNDDANLMNGVATGEFTMPAQTGPFSSTPSSFSSNTGAAQDDEQHGNGKTVEPANGAEADQNQVADLLDETSALIGLTANVRDQDELERDIEQQASLALMQEDDKRDEKRIEKIRNMIAKLETQKKTQDERYRKAAGNPFLTKRSQDELARIRAEIDLAKKNIKEFELRIQKRHQENEEDQDANRTIDNNKRLPNETHRDFLIRTGKITPFDLNRAEDVDGELAAVMADAEVEDAAVQLEEEAPYEPRSHQNLRAPGFAEDADIAAAAVQQEFGLRSRKRRRPAQIDAPSASPNRQRARDPDAEYVESEQSDDYDMTERPPKKTKSTSKGLNKIDISNLDDGIEANYQARLKDWVDRRSRARARRQQSEDTSGAQDQNQAEEEEWFKPSPDEPDHDLPGGLKIPGDIYPALFDYQKTGVKWLAELYSHRVGGIVGDEMGLGKTVQVISFIAALHYSKRLDGPVIVVAPATVLQQWVNEFHRWWPALRVLILHSSGSGMLNMKQETRFDDDDRRWDNKPARHQKTNKSAQKIVDRVAQNGHVLVTTYASIQMYGDLLAPIHWGYAVLDEGHKIRNPNAAVTIMCKELLTPNRIILSGTPIQNNLVELWSLFDFVFPMRLGTLIEFRQQIEVPIKLGGYANASNLQIMTAEKTAQILKDCISPCLLQRFKVDVAADLPKKKEQVLFCKLTKQQYENYKSFLGSKDMEGVIKGSTKSFFAIDRLRKICNHPDLLDPDSKAWTVDWGAAYKSGKMQVLKSLLPMWKKLGNKTLLFTQGVLMLDILEQFVQKLGNIGYLRMDGQTPIKTRQNLVDKFNNDPGVDLFLLTTKVGGLGVNLTGANRVIIYDPDWNPSTDVQARERAWRLGQKKEVTIYRLMTAGTIEEKIYHRQIFKQLLSNKVLKDPKNRATFNMQDLHDLFTLGSPDEVETETGRLFKNTEVDVRKTSAPPAAANPISNAPTTNDEHSELRRITGVANLADYEDEEEKEKAKQNDEDRIMEALFARSGLHAAHEHDAIMDSKVRPSRAMLEQEASLFADAAAQVLGRAEQQARNVPIGTVTWTGEYGEGGLPPNNIRERGGAGSSSALANLSRQQGVSRSAERPRMGLNDFVKAIPEFIRAHGGRVPSKAMVDHFTPQCRTHEQMVLFRSALRSVARIQSRGTALRGIWVLRDDLQDRQNR